jgi:hypothetical protein
MHDRLAVIVPTRSRPHQIEPIAQAWGRTGAWGVADLIFVIDQDDPRVNDYLHEMANYVQVQRVVAREWEPLVPKLNRWALQAASDYAGVAFMGDDHIPRTTMWAHYLIKEAMVRRPSIAYGRDGHHDRDLPTWWSMSSDIVLALEGMVPAPVEHLFCDNAVKLLGGQTRSLIYLDEVLIEHMHPAAGKGEPDAQYKRFNRREQYDRDQGAFRDWALSPAFQEAKGKILALHG